MPAKKRTAKRLKTKPSLKKPTTDYVSIEEPPKDPIKQKILWLAVGAIFLIIVVFWFWTIRQNLRLDGNADFASDISQTITEARDIYAQTQEMINQPSQAAELEKIKQEIIAQLQVNLNSADWPTHTSEILDLSLKYPTDWTKKETLQSLVLTAPGKLPAQMAITSRQNRKKLSLEKWLWENKPAGNYPPTPITLAGQNGFKYAVEEENNLSYLIYFDRAKAILEIKVSAENGKNLYEPIFNQILKTLNFTE